MHKDSGEKITRRRQEKPLPFPEEQIHLAQTLERLEEAFAEAGESRQAGTGIQGGQTLHGGQPGRDRPAMKCSRTNFF